MITFIIIMISWLIIEALGIINLDDSINQLKELPSVTAALILVFLLFIDVLIPIPSTTVMTVTGTIFGIWSGIIISILGSIISSVAAYLLGRFGRVVLIKKFISKTELKEMKKWNENLGRFTILIARGLPMMAETIGISAGISKMNMLSFMTFTILGTIPVCIAYVLAGDRAESVEEIFMIAAFGFLVTFLITLAIRKRLKDEYKSKSIHT